MKKNLSSEDIEGLPSELLDELLISRSDQLTQSIREILLENNKPTSIDHILIGLYRKTGKIHKRKSYLGMLIYP